MRERTVILTSMQFEETFVTSFLISTFEEALISLTSEDFIVFPAGAQSRDRIIVKQAFLPPMAPCNGSLTAVILQASALESDGQRRIEAERRASLTFEVMVHL
ncbi:MAG: hypothetical protein WBX25_17925 [Rhodomicrobium sp.]